MRAFLRLLEKHGAGALLAADFDAAMEADGAEVTRALVAAGVVKDGARASTWPCDGAECARDVREVPGRVRLVAVCTRHPAECEMVRLDAAAVAQRVIDVEAFARLVQATLRLDAPAAARGRVSPSTPLHLGEQEIDGVARDVFLARRADSPALRALLAERSNVPRRTLVLVLTAWALPPELAARYATGRVVIEVLSDRMTVRAGSVVEVPRFRVVDKATEVDVVTFPGRDEPERPLPSGRSLPRGKVAPANAILASLPRPSRWGEVTLFGVEDETMIGVEIGRKQVHLAAADLGLGSKKLRRPTQPFKLLRVICDGNGMFVTRAFGSSANGKTLLSDVRGALCLAFGLEDDPFEKYSKRYKCWKPKFVALACTPILARSFTSDRKWMDGERDGVPKIAKKKRTGRKPR